MTHNLVWLRSESVGRVAPKWECTRSQKVLLFGSFPTIGSCVMASQDLQSCSSSAAVQFFSFFRGTLGESGGKETVGDDVIRDATEDTEDSTGDSTEDATEDSTEDATDVTEEDDMMLGWQGLCWSIRCCAVRKVRLEDGVKQKRFSQKFSQSYNSAIFDQAIAEI